MDKNKRILSTVTIIAGILLIVAAVSLVIYNMWDDKRAGAVTEKVCEKIDVLDIEPAPLKIPDYILNPEMDMPAVEIDGYRYIGTVRIPSLNLKLPVMENWSYPRMKISPCRYTGSVYLNNMIICAHNYATHFGRLKNLVFGDKVIFKDMDGNTFNYEVKEIDTLEKMEIEKMQSGDWDLTLFTCTLGGRTRVTVRCSLIKK